MKTKIEKSEKTICFSRENFLERLKQYINFDTSGKPAVKIADTEGPAAAPVAANSGKKTCAFSM